MKAAQLNHIQLADYSLNGFVLSPFFKSSIFLMDWISIRRQKDNTFAS